MNAFNPSTLDFSVSLMNKGKIDPQTYSWYTWETGSILFISKH